MTGRNARVSKSTVLFSDVWLHPDGVRFTGEQKTPRKSIQSNWIFELKQQTMGKIGHYTHKIHFSWMKDQYVAVHVYRHKPIGEIIRVQIKRSKQTKCEKGLKQRHDKGKKTLLTILDTTLICIFFIYNFIVFFHKHPKFLWNKIK